MPDIHIRRAHKLGLPKARKLAWRWAEDVEQRFGMACTVVEGDDRDVVEFTRPGVNGRLVVAADHFDLQASLGFLLGAFRSRIESEIEQNLDALLAAQGRPSAKARPATGKSASGKTASAGSAPRPTDAKPAPRKAASRRPA